ncbi:MAG: cupin domain-containing protein [Williamsia sp.]|nr:cupin domain-containing protein [Williamsia sp.]
MPALEEIGAREIIPGFFGRFIHGEQSSLAFWDIKKGSVMPEHQHPHEQITFVTEGAIQMVIGGKEFLFTRGMCHVIPPHTPHSAVAVEDCTVIDSFSPARDDYR